MSNKFLATSVMAATAFLTSPAYAGIFSEHAKTKNLPPEESFIRLQPDIRPTPEDPPESEVRPSLTQGHERSEKEMSAGYNAPGRIGVVGKWDFFASGSFILWMPMQDKFDLGTKYNNSSGLPNEDRTNIPFDFKYRPGFKVAFGLNLNYDNWALSAEWTRLNGNETTRKGTTLPEVILPQWQIGSNDGFVTHVTVDWDFHFNIIDFDFSRSCYVGTKLIFTPFFGARLFYNHQKVRSHIHDTSAITVLAKSKQKLWELGPMAGMNGSWLLGKGFRVEGDLALSLLYAKIRTRHKENGWIGPPATADIVAQKSRTHSQGLKPNLDIAAGLGWGRYIYQQRQHIDFSAKYEFLCFWDNNLLPSNLGSNGVSNLYFQGLTVTAKLDF